MFENKEIFNASGRRIMNEQFDSTTNQSIFRDAITNKMLFTQENRIDGTSVFKDPISGKILGWKK